LPIPDIVKFTLFSFALGAFTLFALFFLRAFVLFFASRSQAQKRKKTAGTYLWLLLSLITMESVQDLQKNCYPMF
jgi:hypothetical protein